MTNPLLALQITKVQLRYYQGNEAGFSEPQEGEWFASKYRGT